MGYGKVCRDLTGVILYVYYGSIRMDTNNTAELEEIIQGLKIVSRSGWLLVTPEGDSRVII